MSNLKYQRYYGHDHQEDFSSVFSWPQRSYTCSFCKREFRSAQALGGHMNVHRRDRARLRQSPPSNLPNLNLDPNPNINFNLNPSVSSTSSSSSLFSPTTEKLFPPFIATLPPLFSTTTTNVPWDTTKRDVAADFSKIKGTRRLLEIEKFGTINHDQGEEKNKAEIIRLEVEIGLLGEAKEDLDLELRLGYTTST